MSQTPRKGIEKIDTWLEDFTVIGTQSEESQKSANPDMTSCVKSVIVHFQSIETFKIASPFQITCLQITEDENYLYFGTKREDSIPARIGLIEISTQEINLEVGVGDKSIWTIALSKDEKFFYTAGQNPNIIKYMIPDLNEVDCFVGHDDQINKILITEDDKWLFSASDDSTIRMWSVDSDSDSDLRETILFTSSGKIYTIDITEDQKYLCSGDSNGKIVIIEISYSLKISSTVIYVLDHYSAIWSIKLSPSGTFFAIGDEKGLIKLYNFFSWELLTEFNHGDCIRDLDISAAEDIIVSAGDNTQVKIWDIQKRYKEITFSKHTNIVKSVKIMKDQKHILSYGEEKSILIWKIPSFETKKIMDSSNMQVLHLWFSELRIQLEGICIINDEKFIMSWDSSGASKPMMRIDIEAPKFCKNIEETEEIFIAGTPLDRTIEKSRGDVGESYTMICIYDIGSKRLVRGHLIKACMQSFHVSGNMLFIGESFKISIWNYDTCTYMRTVFTHNGEIRAVVTAFNDTLLFSLGTDQVLRKFTLDFKGPQEKFSKEVEFRDGYGGTSYEIENEQKDDYNQNITFVLQVSEDNQYLYVASQIRFEIIYTRNFCIMYSNDISYIGMFKSLNNTLCLLYNQGMDIYSSKSFQIISKVTYDFEFEKVTVGAENRFLFFLGNNLITKIQNPLKCKDITFIGPSSELIQFQDHVISIINGKCDRPFLSSHWIIEPLHINLLHIYAYFNLYDVLKDAIIGEENGNRIAFFESSEQFSPLSLSLEMGFVESTDAIIEGLRKVVKKDTSKTALKDIVFQIFEENMDELNIAGYKSLNKFYRKVLVREDLPSLPHFCPPELSLPVLVKSDLYYIFHKEFGLGNKILDSGVAVLFSKTIMRFYLTLGSSKSIEFMKSIENCPNTGIYYTKFIQLVLQDKWKGVRWYMWAQAFLYLCYIILLSLYTTYKSTRKPWFLIFPFAINCVLYAYELVFVVLGPLDYFLDFWNVVDTVRSWLMMIYTIMVWTGFFHLSIEKDSKEGYMLAVLLFVSWVRGITYFRINAKTRYLIHLLFQVIIDIIPFLIILFYSAVGFGLTFRAFQANMSADFLPSLSDSWLTILGSWTNPTNPDLHSLTMLFATLLNPIISLNLLIAILTDTFEVVSEDQVIADGKELAGMILEIETLMFWARNENKKTFLHIMEDDNVDEEVEEDVNKLINNIRSKIFYISDNFRLHENVREKLKEAFDNGDQKLAAKLEVALRKSINAKRK
ncbi:hypothetical protein SteCoe_6515 [Stentor coeruleus]|uniref:Uncharacterized protein n=1 Tax=Stentor coeruleus TaxID=5963 RepID=A0A1R2CPV6_9CILI|nr:hypothetical protein SteCoe_6515 [Stentor coeruleus]